MISPIGYFKVYRELFSKPIWYNSNSKHKTILITLIAMANWKESEWEHAGVKYKAVPGQFITSVENIAKTSGKDLTNQNVRTSLKRFENLGFLTIKTTNKKVLRHMLKTRDRQLQAWDQLSENQKDTLEQCGIKVYRVLDNERRLIREKLKELR
jgi:hypothetical protein